MRKIYDLIFLSLIALSFLSVFKPTHATTPGYLSTDGINIYNSANELVVFNGICTKTLFGYPEYNTGTAWITNSTLDTVRGHGLNLIRLEVSLDMALYGISISDYSTYYAGANPTVYTGYYAGFWTQLDKLVEHAASIGLWCNIVFIQTQGMAALGGSWGNGNGFPAFMFNGSWTGYQEYAYPNNSSGWSDGIRDFWWVGGGEHDLTNVRQAYQMFMVSLAYRYADNPNVIFGLYNEPQTGGGETIWDNNYVVDCPTQAEGATLYRTFMENTIALLKSIAPDNLYFVNVPYLWDFFDAEKVDLPNVVVEAHTYSYGLVDSYFYLGWDYSQPFFLGEFGGVEESLMSRQETVNL